MSNDKNKLIKALNEVLDVENEYTEAKDEKAALEWLQGRIQEMDRPVVVREVIPGYPLDAALAFKKALQAIHGWTDLVPTQTMFGPQPPVMVNIPVDADGNTKEVPWGKMRIPGVVGTVEPSISFDKDGNPTMTMVGTVQKRSVPLVKKVAAKAKELLKTDSLYKGKAIRAAFKDFKKAMADGVEFDPVEDAPKFLLLNGVDQNQLIFNEEVQWAINTSIFGPIQRREFLKKVKTPFKRGILLAGPYGVGKTLLANVTAKLCTENGVTFIYLEKTGDIAMARAFARQYAPAVIFAEDIDAVLAGSDRDEEVNNILNVLDGVEGKSDEVMVIFSSNHPDRIQQPALRPGRIDMVLTISPPNQSSVERLLRLYARDLLAKSVDVSRVASLLVGQIPAVIREVVERAKLAAIVKAEKASDIELTEEDLYFSAKSMEGHLELLNAKPPTKSTEVEKFGRAIGRAIVEVQ